MEVGPFNGEPTHVIDLGEVALIPGLVNAHTHLEFSDLERPLGDPSLGFTRWIESVVAHRKQSLDAQGQSNKSPAIAQGISESLDAGVVALGEISSNPWPTEAYGSEMTGVVFHEQLGNDPRQATELTAQIAERLRDFPNLNWRPGISPHAPYSNSLNLFQSLVNFAETSDVPVAMHLAETLEEVEFVETGKGAFAEMLDSMGIAFNRSGAMTTSDYLHFLSKTKSLIIHGNFLSSDELELISEYETMQVVFCPRTHAYFGHPEYPLRTMLDLGIQVAVGTDSRASNPDLNLFDDLKQIARSQPTVQCEEILRMGTEYGALALGLDSQFGTLQVGKSDQMCVVQNVSGQGDPWAWLLSDESTCLPLQKFIN